MKFPGFRPPKLGCWAWLNIPVSGVGNQGISRNGVDIFHFLRKMEKIWLYSHISKENVQRIALLQNWSCRFQVIWGIAIFAFFSEWTKCWLYGHILKRKSNSRSMQEKTVFSWMFVAPFPRGNPGVREFPAGETSQVREGSLNTPSRQWAYHVNGEKLPNNFIYFSPKWHNFWFYRHILKENMKGGGHSCFGELICLFKRLSFFTQM